MFSENEIRNILFQVLSGLAFVHRHGYFHRDMKPENLLCMGPELVKIADFGLAREIRSQPPYTDYVSTRWYRAPEVLLKSNSYSSPIDIWAVGCIMAELYTLRPLFPGNSEVDEIFKICQVLGTLKKSDWPEGYNLAASMNFRFPKCVPTSLKSLIPNASDEAITLMKDMLQWDPEKRPSAAQSLRYPYFHVGQALGAPLKHSEQHKAQAEMSEAPTEPTPQPLYKTELQSSEANMSQTESQTYSQSPHQPLKQIPLPQENIEQSTKQAVAPKTRTEGQQEPLSLVKNRKPMSGHSGGITECLHQRGAATGAENSVSAVRTGRRRWGQTSFKSVSSWDDGGDADVGVSISKKPTISLLKDRTPDGPSCRLTELKNNTVGKSPGNTGVNRADSTTFSAKQHYLRQSRYLPGVNPISSSSAGGRVTDRNLWSNSCLTRGQGLEIPLKKDSFMSNKSNNPAKTFTPPFQRTEAGAARQRVTLAPIGGASAIDLSSAADLRTNSKIKPPTNKLSPSNEEYEGWRTRTPQIPGSSTSSMGKNSFLRSTNIQPVHGRVDWTAKYGGNR
ncbi:serine/threonine-protein kinase MAK-like isoform X2 [Anabas testudineus]|uniref:serine/threonine-protein kinase MAK-like isoform X2 n=1 Tax=Anabas testudineus TaxID=64144 RepID=UPI000E454B02|nr:serine/threonine-protein kinase MAK-like isoform X2 [Anabas testudineus]